MYIEHHIGIAQSYSGTLVGTEPVLEPVDDCILDTIGHEPGVGEFI